MPNFQRNLDGVFRALSDPTRRGVLATLSTGPRTVSELAEAYDMALPSFTQHLKVLEQSGLVESKKVGRRRAYALVPERLNEAERWLGAQRKVWSLRLDRLDSYLKQMQEKP